MEESWELRVLPLPPRAGPLPELPLLFPLRGRLSLERGRPSRRSPRESLLPSVERPPRLGVDAPATEPRGLERVLLRRWP